MQPGLGPASRPNLCIARTAQVPPTPEDLSADGIAWAWGRRWVRLYPGTAQLPGVVRLALVALHHAWCGGRFAKAPRRGVPYHRPILDCEIAELEK